MVSLQLFPFGLNISPGVLLPNLHIHMQDLVNVLGLRNQAPEYRTDIRILPSMCGLARSIRVVNGFLSERNCVENKAIFCN